MGICILNTHELLVEFVRKGGVITLHNSGDADKPIRFSLRYDGQERTGRTSNLDRVLVDQLEPPRLYDYDDWAERPDCMP